MPGVAIYLTCTFAGAAMAAGAYYLTNPDEVRITYLFTIYLLFTTSVDNVGSALSRPDLGPDLGSTLTHTILPSSVQFIGKLAPDVAEDKQKLKESA